MTYKKGWRLYCETCGDVYGELTQDIISGEQFRLEHVLDPQGTQPFIEGAPIRCHNDHKPFLTHPIPEPVRTLDPFRKPGQVICVADDFDYLIYDEPSIDMDHLVALGKIIIERKKPHSIESPLITWTRYSKKNCTCGAQKIGCGSHSEWCDVVQ